MVLERLRRGERGRIRRGYFEVWRIVLQGPREKKWIERDEIMASIKVIWEVSRASSEVSEVSQYSVKELVAIRVV